MAYTAGYDYDIFISYSRDDNVVLPGEKAGWVTQFRDYLENWLVKRRGLKGLNIWFDDQGLRGSTAFDAEIQQAIEKTAIFLVLHSHNYQGSAYCRKELGWFMTHNRRFRNGIMVGNDSRLFNVLISNIHHQQWPEELVGTVGFKLHDAPDKTTQFGYPLEMQAAAFDKTMRQLVEAATDLMDALRKQMPTPLVSVAEDTPNDLPRIFLADVADTLKPFRKRLLAEIGDKAVILPSLPPPYEPSEHQQKLAETLQQASLSIHLLDQWGGREVDGMADMTFPRLHAGAVRQRATPSLVWVADTLQTADIEDEQHAHWLYEMEHAQRDASGFHFVRNSRQAFIDQVLQTLEQLKTATSAQGGTARFLIDTHQKDQRYAYRLADILTEHGMDVDFNKESSDPVKSLENFERVVKEVQHLIVVFGNVAPQWVKGRVQTAFKIASGQMDTALQGIWVFMLPYCQGKDSLKFPPLFRVGYLENSCDSTVDRQVIETLLKGGQ